MLMMCYVPFVVFRSSLIFPDGPMHASNFIPISHRELKACFSGNATNYLFLGEKDVYQVFWAVKETLRGSAEAVSHKTLITRLFVSISFVFLPPEIQLPTLRLRPLERHVGGEIRDECDSQRPLLRAGHPLRDRRVAPDLRGAKVFLAKQYRNNSCPAGVSSIPVVWRINKGVPISSSSLAIL